MHMKIEINHPENISPPPQKSQSLSKKCQPGLPNNSQPHPKILNPAPKNCQPLPKKCHLYRKKLTPPDSILYPENCSSPQKNFFLNSPPKISQPPPPPNISQPPRKFLNPPRKFLNPHENFSTPPENFSTPR